MDVTVAAATGGPSEPTLPNTGQNVQPLTYVAVASGLLAVGFFLILGGRTRRRQTANSAELLWADPHRPDDGPTSA